MSPAGFPVSNWWPAVGLFFALPRILGGPGLDWMASLQIMAALASSILVIVMAVAAYRCLAGQPSLVVLTVGLLFGGTNLAFYTLHASSELVVLLIVTATTLLVRLDVEARGSAWLALGASAAVLILAGAQATPLLLPAVALLAADALSRRPRRRALLGPAAAGGFLAAVAMGLRPAAECVDDREPLPVTALVR